MFAEAMDSNGSIYLTGMTCSSDFPVVNAYQSTLAGNPNGFVTKFAFNANPAITASPVPPPNGSGWNNSAVTVSFTCIPGAAPISSCTSPTQVTTEGASQVVTGTALDTASNSSSTTVTVNLDMTAPSVSITSPSNGSSVGTPYVTVTGSVSDALSGVGGVSCNGVPATVSSGSFSCTVQLSLPSNTITATATDLAGNTSSTSITVNIGMGTATSIQVTPNPITVVVGNTQSFTAIDQTGLRRPDATWSVSDTSIATLAADGSGTITAVAAGTVTVTATVGSASAQSTVTVVAASSLTQGTVLWTAPTVTGFATHQIVQAVPTANGPDLYAVDLDASTNILVRAFKSDGEQLWQSPISASTFELPYDLQRNLAGDNAGGLILNGFTTVASMIDLDGPTGNQKWQITAATTDDSFSFAVGPSNVYAVEAACAQDPTSGNYLSCLDTLDPNTGAVQGQVQLPTSSNTFSGPCSMGSSGNAPGNYSSPIVGPDGSLYLEIDTWVYHEDDSCSTFSTSMDETLSLWKSDGSSQTLSNHTQSKINDYASQELYPGPIIPDGNGGILAGFGQYSSTYPYPFYLVDTGATGPIVVPNVTYSGTPSMVLGDNNTAFVTDGTNVVSIDLRNLSQNWNYTSTGGTLSFKNATPGTGVLVDDSQLGAIQLGSNGGVAGSVAGLQGALPLDMSTWYGTSSQEFAAFWSPDGTGGLSNEAPQSDWAFASGNQAKQAQPPRCSVNRLNCVLAPISDVFTSNQQNRIPPRVITYGVFSLKNGILQPLYDENGTYGPFKIALEEQHSSQNNDQNTLICMTPPCVNAKDDTQSYRDGKFIDELKETLNGVTIGVTQLFLVEDSPVSVYWPESSKTTQPWGYVWFGAKSQTAATTTSSSVIQQINRGTKTAVCGTKPYTSSIACDVTGP